VMLFLITSNLSCASLQEQSPPKLELRTLRISKEITGFEYQYQVCVRFGLFGNCKEYKITKELYDLADPAVRNQLIDMGFVAKVRDKIIP
jgi:hypothetical protein